MMEGKSKPGTVSQADMERRMTDVVVKLRRRAKFDGSDNPQNAEARILDDALKKPSLQRLFDSKPKFYHEDESAKNNVHLEPEFESLRESETFQELLVSPTQFIEHKLSVVDRGESSMAELPKGKDIRELIEKPYDISRVKLLYVDGKKFVVKRVDSKKVGDELREYAIAKRVLGLGIPTPRPIGWIRDRGNLYEIFEYIEHTKDMNEVSLDRVLSEREIGSVSLDLDDCFERARIEESSLTILSVTPELKEEYTQLCNHELGCQLASNFFNNIFRILNYYQSTLSVFSEKVRGEMFGLIESRVGIHVDETTFSNQKNTEIFLSAMEREGLTEDSFINISVEFEELRKRITRAIIEECLPRIYEEVERKLWGASISGPYCAFKDRVREQMDKVHIPHKDLNSRNILVQLDDKEENIASDEHGNAQFYVIDFEEL